MVSIFNGDHNNLQHTVSFLPRGELFLELDRDLLKGFLEPNSEEEELLELFDLTEISSKTKPGFIAPLKRIKYFFLLKSYF